MHRLLRMLAVWLSLTMAAALPGAHALAIPPTQTGHPAGCHGGPATPSPAPTSYQCCVNGHHGTIPSVSFSVRPLLAQFARLDGGEDFSLASVLSARSSLNIVTASSPPGIAPLRI